MEAEDRTIDEALRLRPGQEALTPAQEAEARRFVAERVRAQLSTEPVDEQEAERWLRQSYEAAGLEPPKTIIWLDGPLQLLSFPPEVAPTVWLGVGGQVGGQVGSQVWYQVEAQVREQVRRQVWEQVWNQVGGVYAQIEGQARVHLRGWRRRDHRWHQIQASLRAYRDAPQLAYYRFFDEYLAPNAFHALAHFNELVSGYHLEKDIAVLVRRPRVLSRDVQGRLHSASGKCIEYLDGWGFYRWHGMAVLAKVILQPEALTRKDFLKERNVEVRRIIMERMGDRFVPELRGRVIDTGPRGHLYEVDLPDDPERVARYVCVQDASTPRRYFLRVPPHIKTAAEAVAWTFSLTIETYQPLRET
jgi:hypothetical protein